MGDYAIVEFCECHDVAVVPVLWLTESEEASFWPPAKTSSINRLVKLKKPHEESWERYSVRVLGKASTFERALEKQAEAQYTSDISTEAEGVVEKRRRTRKRKFPIEGQVSEGSEGPSGEEIPQPRQKSVKKLRTMKPNHLIEDDDSDATDEDLFGEIMPPSRPLFRGQRDKVSEFVDMQDVGTQIQTALESQNLYGERTLRKLVSTVLELRSDVKAVLNYIKTNGSSMLQPTEAPEDFPLSTKVDLRRWQSLLKNREEKDELVSAFRDMGGQNLDDLTRWVMKHLITDELALTCNITGKNGKEPLGDTPIFDILFAAVKANHVTDSCTKKDVEEALRKWLTGARDRGGRRAERARRSANENCQ